MRQADSTTRDEFGALLRDGSPGAEVSEDLHDRVMAAVRHQAREALPPAPHPWRWAAAACALVVLVLILLPAPTGENRNESIVDASDAGEMTDAAAGSARDYLASIEVPAKGLPEAALREEYERLKRDMRKLGIGG